MPVLEVNGVRLSYELSGEGPVAVLLAGRGMPADWWTEEHLRPYREAAYSVLRFDHRGMPPSESPQEPFTLVDLVDDGAALLDALGLSECVLVGYSMGSLVAQELAHRRPDLVRAVAVLGTLARQPGWLDVFHRGAIELFESGAGSQELLLGMLFGQMYDPAELTDDERVMPWLEELLSEPEWEDPGRINQWRAYAGYRADPVQLARIAVPCLVVSFERDLIMPPVLGREVAQAIPNARFVEVPAAGHWGVILDPGRAHRIVLDFLREVEETPAPSG
jgi:pimeloyl-ACP methyl ester carboxylesterase